MTTILRQIAAAALLGLTAACASGGQPVGEGGDRATSREVRRRSDVISTAEIDQNRNRATTEELIQALRPQWLRVRGQTGPLDQGQIQVYVNGSHAGTQAALRNIPVSGLISIQFLPGLQAANRFGGGHEHGAILITSN